MAVLPVSALMGVGLDKLQAALRQLVAGAIRTSADTSPAQPTGI